MGTFFGIIPGSFIYTRPFISIGMSFNDDVYAFERAFPTTNISHLRDLPIVSVSIVDYERFYNQDSKQTEDMLCAILEAINPGIVETISLSYVLNKTERMRSTLKRFNNKVIEFQNESPRALTAADFD